MSYRIENEGMGFLNKLVDALNELDEEMNYLEVDTCNVLRSTDRHPYTEDDEAEDFPFSFSYKGKEFRVKPKNRNGFTLKIEEVGEQKSHFSTTMTFTKKERMPSLKKKWKDVFKEIEKEMKIEISPRYFFDQWCSSQNFGWVLWRDVDKKEVVDRFYQEIAKRVDPKELEEHLAKRYEEKGSRLDASIETGDLGMMTKVKLYDFLDDWFVVTSHTTVFVFDNQDEALEKYEEETVLKIREKIKEKVERYQRTSQ